jgi:indolepyruvate ferredoxin oxidoreductase beta subunit
MEQANFLLVGVGGQGILTAGDILAQLGLQAGYEVKKSEVHGMSQRGGAVNSHVRFGRVVYSPLIGRGGADYLLAFEMLEALRWVHFLHPRSVVLVNDERLPPLAVTSGGARYPEPEEVRRELAGRAGRVLFIEGARLSRELGNPRVANAVLLGALSTFLPFAPSLWEEVIRARVPARHFELNRQAFYLGRAQVGESG